MALKPSLSVAAGLNDSARSLCNVPLELDMALVFKFALMRASRDAEPEKVPVRPRAVTDPLTLDAAVCVEMHTIC